jgi:hypothetical protein
LRAKIAILLLIIVSLAFVGVEALPVRALSTLAVDLYGGAVNGGNGTLVGVHELTDLAFPAPYGGEGPDNPMEINVEPQTLVYLNAYVTANSVPVQNETVSFEMLEPLYGSEVTSTLYTTIMGFTDSGGVASISARMPWPSTNPESLLGTWTVNATVQVDSQIAVDTMQFQYAETQSGLTVDLYGGAVNGGHGNPVGIIEQTDLAFPAPYGGEGPNNPMDIVEPQTLVYLNAFVTANSVPVQNETVSFEMQEPNSALYATLGSVTDSMGVASVSTMMPWQSPNPDGLLGTWTVTAIVQGADQFVEDTMQFQYDYIVHIWNVTTDNPPPEPGPPPGYGHGDPVNVYVTYGSYFMQQLPTSQPYPVLILAEIGDNLNVTIGTAEFTTTVGGAAWDEYMNWTISVPVCSSCIPKSAFSGTAWVIVSVYDGKDPIDGGVAIAPEWVGPSIEILPINVPPKASVTFDQLGVGSDYNGTVVVVDSVGYSAAQLPISFIWNVGSTHSFEFLSRLVSSVTTYHWNSTTGLSTLESASMNVTNECGTITGIYITGIHEVIVTSVTGPPWTYQDIPVIPHECANITVTVWNIGDFAEDVVITLYYNITADQVIGSLQIHLGMNQNYTHTFVWVTVGVPVGIYTLVAVATIPTGSNTFIDGNITVRLKGDVNGDGKIDMKDIVLVARALGSAPTSPNWNPAADVNCDGVVNMKDLAIVVRFFGSRTTAY